MWQKSVPLWAVNFQVGHMLWNLSLSYDVSFSQCVDCAVGVSGFVLTLTKSMVWFLFAVLNPGECSGRKNKAYKCDPVQTRHILSALIHQHTQPYKNDSVLPPATGFLLPMSELFQQPALSPSFLLSPLPPPYLFIPSCPSPVTNKNLPKYFFLNFRWVQSLLHPHLSPAELSVTIVAVNTSGELMPCQFPSEVLPQSTR